VPSTATEAPPRACPHCGFEEDRGGRERCSRCGRSVLVRPPRLRGRRGAAVIAGALAVLVLGTAIVAVLLTGATDRREAAQRRADAKVVAAERVRLRRLQTPHRGAAPSLRPKAGASDAEVLAARASLVRAAEASITADARARARAGELDGPIRATECGSLVKDRDAVPDDRVLSKPIGRYDCVAVKRDVVAGTGEVVAKLGYDFVTALDFRRFTYVWCRNTPPPGEAGKALATVRLDRACLAATGPAIGTGYVDVPGPSGAR
jgi:hypothetical protein